MLFLFGCAGSSLLLGLFPRCGGRSSCCAWPPHRVASLVVVHGLQDTQASVAVGHGHTIWDVPRSGIELASPELAGRFFTTEPPGKSSLFFSFFFFLRFIYF